MNYTMEHAALFQQAEEDSFRPELLWMANLLPNREVVQYKEKDDERS